MKIQLTFKTPDIVSNWEDQALESFTNGEFEELGDDYDQAADELAMARDWLNRNYIKYGECVTVEFDTETEAALVVSIK